MTYEVEIVKFVIGKTIDVDRKPELHIPRFHIPADNAYHIIRGYVESLIYPISVDQIKPIAEFFANHFTFTFSIPIDNLTEMCYTITVQEDTSNG